MIDDARLRLVGAAKLKLADPAELLKASEFLSYKTRGMHFAADEIGRVLDQWSGRDTGSVAWGGTPAEFLRLHVFLDLFLFEGVALKDAIAQLANAALALGVSADSDALLGEANAALRAIIPSGTDTGLYEWQRMLSWKGSWFWVLNDFRNQATHRNLVQVVQELEIVFGDPAPVPRSTRVPVAIATNGGGWELLKEFVSRNRQQLEGLGEASLLRLTKIRETTP